MRASAQNPPVTSPPEPQASPRPSLEKKLITNIIQDQRAIFTSPLHIQGEDTKYLVSIGLATAALIATDRRTTNELVEDGDNQTRLSISNNLSRLGSVYGTSGIAAAFYLAGRATNNARARETGLLGAEALVDGLIVTSVLKVASQRPRPPFDQGRGNFRDDGDSFPSGHAVGAWAMATIVAHEYRDHRLFVFGAYGLATAVSVSRYTGRNHFLSDSLVGSAIGFGIGRYVYHRRHDPNLGTGGKNPTTDSTSGITGSKLVPLFASQFCHSSNTYGLKLSWGF